MHSNFENSYLQPLVPGDPKKKTSHLFLLWMIVAVIVFFAYIYEPTSGMDLGRYYKTIVLGTDFTETNYWGEQKKPDLFIIWILKIWNILGLSPHSFGAFIAFIFFGLHAKIASLWAHRVSVNNNPIVLFLLMIFSGFFLAYSGVRQGNANSLLVLSIVYYELGDKKKSLFFAVLAPMIHFSLLPMVAFWYIAICFKQKVVKVLSIVLVVLSFVSLSILSEVQLFLYRIGGFGSAIAGKMDAYIFEGAGSWGNILRTAIFGDIGLDTQTIWAGSRWLFCSTCVTFLTLILCAIFYKRIAFSFKEKAIERFIVLVLAYIIFAIQAPSVFSRMLGVVKILLILGLFYPAFKMKGQLIAKFFIWGIIIFALLSQLWGKDVLDFFSGGSGGWF